MDVKFSQLQFLMKAISGFISNWSINTKLSRFKWEPPFIRIKTDIYDSINPIYYEEKKKSNRGRKKKEKKKSGSFDSNIAFYIRNPLIKKTKNKTSSNKDFIVRIFNKGKIVCVGILHEKMEDFLYAFVEIKKYLIRYIMRYLLVFNFPIDFCRRYYDYLQNNINLIEYHSTLENYQFHVNYFLNIEKIRIFYDKSSSEIINIDLNNLYTFLTKKCSEGEFTYDTNSILEKLEEKESIKKNVVSKQKLYELLFLEIDLKMIYVDFIDIWETFPDNVKSSIKIKTIYLKEYIKFRLKKHVENILVLGYHNVESIYFKEEKKTLIVTKKVNSQNISIRIFGTNCINIQGARDVETVKIVYEDLKETFRENLDLLYLKDNPPLLSYKEILDN